jgi:hypothetical protein
VRFGQALRHSIRANPWRGGFLGIADTKRIQAPHLVTVVLTTVYGLLDFPALLRMFTHAARVPRQTCRTRYILLRIIGARGSVLCFEPMASRTRWDASTAP